MEPKVKDSKRLKRFREAGLLGCLNDLNVAKEVKMGIYYLAVDDNDKTFIKPPRSYANKSPGIYHPKNPFPAMVIMKNIQGYNYNIINDCGSWYEIACEYKDVTEEVYKELIKTHPEWEKT